MQITFMGGYSRWIVDVTGEELDALASLMSKAVKCHSTWADSAETQSGMVETEQGSAMDLDIRVQSRPLILREWVELPKPDPAPVKLTHIPPPTLQTPHMRDFMDEQLATPAASSSSARRSAKWSACSSSRTSSQRSEYRS